MSPLFAIFGLGWGELVVIGIIAVLLFGRKLPDMAKYLGRSVVEFKKGFGTVRLSTDLYSQANEKELHISSESQE